MSIENLREAKLPDEIGSLRTEIGAKIARHVYEDGEKTTTVPGLTMYRLSAPNQPVPFVNEPHFALIAQGKKIVVLGKEVYAYDESHFLLTSIDLPTMVQVIEASPERPYLSLTLKLDLQLVRQTIAEFDLHSAENIPPGRGITTGPATAELLAPISRILDLLDQPKDIPPLSGLIIREILYRLLMGEQGVRLRQIALLGTQSNRTAKVIAWLKQNYTRPLRIEALAGIAGMGVSTLHHHFRAMTALSPLQYQKNLRLHEARRLMLDEGLDAGSAALRVGYESTPQFNREYRRAFGQPPLRDIKALRISADQLKRGAAVPADTKPINS